MKIPQSPVYLKAYHDAIIEALKNPLAPLYVDTSFLMWLLHAGDEVRSDVLRWCRSMGERIFVPTWSAHELYRHIRKETVLKDVQGRLKHYDTAFKQVLTDMSVSADDSLCEQSDFNDRAHLLQTLRTDFVRLHDQLTIVLFGKKIHGQYHRAVADVIAFVNARVATTDPFCLLDEISVTKDLRFSGRVPPGFKDEDKEGKGDNSCGDLVFWQEVLAHPKARQSTTAIIITNDNKSDWHYKPDHFINYKGERKSGKQHVGLEARLPHPMLEHEAFCKAKIENLVIIDAGILAVVLDRIAPASVKFLVAATHPALLDTKEENGLDWEVIDPDSLRVTAAAVGANLPPASPHVVEETAEEASPIPISTVALQDEGVPTGDFGMLLQSLEGELEERSAAIDVVLEPKYLSSRSEEELLLLGRRVYRSAAVKRFPIDVRLGELIQAAGALQSSKRNSFVLGMFAELYFDANLNIRPTPLDGPWQVLFDLQYQDNFKAAIEKIGDMLAPEAGRLLAVPSCNPVTIPFNVQLVKPPEKGLKHVESIIVAGKELFGDAVPLSPASLSTLVGGPPSTIGALMRAISRRFFVPLRQLVPNREEAQPISWSEEAGLRVFRLDQGGVCDELSLSFPMEEE
jgi:predicted nucleic acid-binding protein